MRKLNTLTTLFCAALFASPVMVGCVDEFHAGCDDDGDWWDDDWDSDDPDARPNDPNDPNDPGMGSCPAETAIYIGRDAAVCDVIEFTCPSDHTSFNNGCGCGCEALPEPDFCPAEDGEGITRLSRDLKVCGTIQFTCPEGQESFNGTCGCGCVAAEVAPPVCPDTADPKVHYLGDAESAQCNLVEFTCPAECVTFNDDCGCGCIEP